MNDQPMPGEWDWVKDNVPVWYRPSLRKAERFAGRVDGEPWCAGGTGDTWMVHLDEMEPGYREGRGTVKAAYLGALEPREELRTPVNLPPLAFKKGRFTFWLHTLGNNGHPYPTQETSTDDDLIELLRQIDEPRLTRILVAATSPRIGDIIGPNIAIAMLIRSLDQILDTGEYQIPFESPAIDQFAQRLQSLRHPDVDFGCDPKDSASLVALRQAIDDYLVWPHPSAEEQGRYEEAVEHSGKLAKRFERIAQAFVDVARELP